MTHDGTAIWERIPEQPSKPAVPQRGDEHERAQMPSVQKWTDEQIAEVLTGLVVSRQYREVEKLMRRVRDDMQAELDAQLEVQAAFNSAMVELIEQQASVLAWAKRAYKFLRVYLSGGIISKLMQDAPDVVRQQE